MKKHALLIDWDRVERVMFRTFTGQAVTEADHNMVNAAYRADPKRYGELSQRVRYAQIARIQKEGW